MYLTLCLCLSSRVLATACNLCNHLKYKKYKPKLQNLQHWGWQNHQQKANTTYIGGFAVLFLDGMSKERKIQKDKVQSVKVEWKNTKNTNIQSAFLEVMEKYNKNTKIQSVFFVILQTNAKQIRMQSQKYKIQQNTDQKFQTYKIKNINLNMNQRANPMFILKGKNPLAKYMQNQPVVFSKPCNSDFVFLSLIFSYLFFCIFNSLQKTLL